VSLDRNEIETANGPVALEKVTAELRFRTDPLGYVVKYEIRAEALTDCVRCAEPLRMPLRLVDEVSLRVKQPQDNHIVLNNSEMNVRFITDTRFDMNTFIEEAIELELPPYPRHAEGDAHCNESGADEGQQEGSPFSVLSKLLDQPNKES
jgi:uncharacterized metal-binding protein YceD (DUF177 family)